LQKPERKIFFNNYLYGKEEKVNFAASKKNLINRYSAMGVTRLKRKDRANKATANNRVRRIKQLTFVPPIKNVDIEAIKASFEAKLATA